MLNTKKDIRKNIISMLIILLVSLVVCILVYKSQVEYGNDTMIKYTLMATHKDNGQVILSKDNPVVYQDFICNVPNLKRIQIEGLVEGSLADSNLKVEVVGLDNGKTYCKKSGVVSKFYNTKAKKKVYKLKKMPKDTEGMVLRLILTLETNAEGRLVFTANNKPGTVMAFNGNDEDHTNIIYRMRYGHVEELSTLYWFICIWLIIVMIILYYLIVISKLNCEKWFPVAAILLGLSVQWIIPVYGVPDEPWHMDTAYQLSNTIMGVDKTPQDGTVLKRECDVVASDLLANDVESNSYYQLWYNTFEKPDNTTLKRVNYVDAGNQVPDIVYLPAALGITVGRFIGASGMITYQLARIFSLLIYVLLSWMAVRIMPFCNSMTAMTALMLISLQQASSASYDAFIIGTIFLFVSVTLKLAYDEKKKNTKLYIVVLILSALLIAVVKGGVYIPVLLTTLLILKEFVRKNQSKKQLTRKIVVAIVLVTVVVISATLYKFYPFVNELLKNTEVHGGERYTLSEIIAHPFGIIYMFWRTLTKNGEVYMRGLFGGMLGWHNIKISWLFIMPIIIGIWFLVHVENERPPKSKFYKDISLLMSGMVIVLVMFAMLLAETTNTASTIWGIQGRYFIPIVPFVTSAFSTPIVTVSKEKSGKIIYIMMVAEMLALIQVMVAYI